MTLRLGALRTAAVVASLLLAGACTNESDSPSGAASPAVEPSPSTSTTPAPATEEQAAVPEGPEDAACYRLTVAQLTRPTNASRPVDCGRRHDAQTIHVGELDMYVDGHAVAVDSTYVQRQLSRTCPRRLAGYLGGSQQDRDLSRFEVVWFSPTLKQSDQGARWFRCDVVALAGPGRLFPLPPPRRLEGLLDRGGPGAFGLCGSAAPGDPDFTRVICAHRHSWRAVATLPIAGGKRYPGVRAARGAGDETCRNRVRSRAGDPLRFRYGWEWPTREQWRSGQRFGYCWAPD